MGEGGYRSVWFGLKLLTGLNLGRVDCGRLCDAAGFQEVWTRNFIKAKLVAGITYGIMVIDNVWRQRYTHLAEYRGIIFDTVRHTMEGEGLTKRSKHIRAWRNNPRNVRFEELESVLRYYGCYVRQPSGGSSHYCFGHPALDYEITVVKRDPVKPHYVRKALRMIDEIQEVLTDDE